MLFQAIHTLHEFVTTTKAVSYLIAVAYLITFPFFWKFLTAREKK